MARTVKDPGERRSELLACAMRLFDEEGYDNVSVRAVARAAGSPHWGMLFVAVLVCYMLWASVKLTNNEQRI